MDYQQLLYHSTHLIQMLCRSHQENTMSQLLQDGYLSDIVLLEHMLVWQLSLSLLIIIWDMTGLVMVTS